MQQVKSWASILSHLRERGSTYSKIANGDRTLFGGQKHLHISSAGLLHLTPFSSHFGLKPHQYFSCCNLELHTSKCTNSRKNCWHSCWVCFFFIDMEDGVSITCLQREGVHSWISKGTRALGWSGISTQAVLPEEDTQQACGGVFQREHRRNCASLPEQLVRILDSATSSPCPKYQQ